MWKLLVLSFLFVDVRITPETKVSGIHDPKHLSGLPGEEAIAIDCFLVLPEGKGTPVVTRILEEMGGACTWISVTVFACLGAPANQVLRDYLLCDS